jgi:hypothetical protein
MPKPKANLSANQDPSAFINRIVKFGVKPADQFLANPKNPRTHPTFQRQAMEEALGKVGFVAPVIETSDGYLLDGHERIYQALVKNSDVPYVVLDIHSDDPDADFVLATFDPLGALASYDANQLDDLLKGMETDGDALKKMLNNLWDTYTPAVYADELSGVRPDEKLDIYLNATIKQVVLLFTNEQYDAVIPKLAAARAREGVETNTELFMRMLDIYEQAASPTD